MIFGIALHSAVAAFFRGIINHVILDIDQLVCVFKIRYESCLPKGLVGNEQAVNILCQEAKRMLELFLASKPPTNIVAIEKPIKYALTSKLDCVGQIDLVVRDTDGVLNVIDLKSTSKTPADEMVQKYTEQCLIYALAYKEIVKAKAWLFLRKKQPEFKTIDLDIDRIEYGEVIEKFTGVAKGISTGIHFRNRSWQCGGCPYSYLCKMETVKVQQEYSKAA